MESRTLYKWPIVKFSRVASRDVPTRRLKSGVFTLNGSNAKFSLWFYPTNVHPEYSKDYSSVFLRSKDLGGSIPVELKYKLWIENSHGEKIKPKLGYTSCKFLKVDYGNGYREFVRHDQLYSPQNGFIKDDFIFVCCEIRYRLPEVDEQNQTTIDVKEWELLNNGFSDWCTIRVGEKEFKVGKSKLMAFSSVFKAMFNSGMEEAQTSIININDTSPMAIEAMIKYLYVQKVDESDGSMTDLYMLADKYDIDGLKKKSSRILIKKLNGDNFVAYLALATNHNDEFLKQGVLDYITARVSGDEFKELILSDEWTKFLKYDEKVVREFVYEFFKVSNWH